MANLWINYFRNENLIMNFQLVYRYILSLSNNEIMFKKKKKKKTTEKREKKAFSGGSRTPVKQSVKLIIFNIFCHGVLPDDAV